MKETQNELEEIKQTKKIAAMLVKTNSDNQEELDFELHNQNGEEILENY